MTREEIMQLNTDYLNGCESEHKMNELFSYALSQEPCDDAISREDAIKAQCEACDICGNARYTKCQYFMQGCNEVKCLRDLPPVMQKLKTGHWIYDETLDNWRCSKCNETPKTMGYVGTADFMAEHFKFCNHCGAKMVEPQESEEQG